jgi:hypothetical protein
MVLSVLVLAGAPLSFRSLTWRQRLGADLDGNVAREGGDADGGAGVAAAVAKGRDHKV